MWVGGDRKVVINKEKAKAKGTGGGWIGVGES